MTSNKDRPTGGGYYTSCTADLELFLNEDDAETTGFFKIAKEILKNGKIGWVKKEDLISKCKAENSKLASAFKSTTASLKKIIPIITKSLESLRHDGDVSKSIQSMNDFHYLIAAYGADKDKSLFYPDFNQACRKVILDDVEKDKFKFKYYFTLLDYGMRMEIPQQILEAQFFYRGLTGMEKKKLELGELFCFKQFISATTEEEVAIKNNGKIKPSALLVIRDIWGKDAASHFIYLGDKYGLYKEKEVIISALVLFKVTNVHTTADITYVHVKPVKFF